MSFKTINWEEDPLKLLDSTKLPGVEAYICCSDHLSLYGAINRLSVRGAPAIGVSAAYGVSLLEYRPIRRGN